MRWMKKAKRGNCRNQNQYCFVFIRLARLYIIQKVEKKGGLAGKGRRGRGRMEKHRGKGRMCDRDDVGTHVRKEAG